MSRGTGGVLAALFFALPLAAADPLVERGFDHFYNLEYPQAIEVFGEAIRQQPDSPDRYNYLAEAIVFQEMLRGGALESELVSGSNPFLRRPRLNASPETEKRFLDALARAMSLAEKRLKSNPRDTGALYSLGISYGLRANWYFLVHKAWRDSLRDATAGRKLHNQISAIDPSNVDARLTQGLHDYIVGSLPLGYRILGFLAGFHGDREKGLRIVREVAAKGDRNRVDAEVFLCALYRRENQPRLAVPLLADLLRRFPRNYLLRFEEAEMYSWIGDKERALAAVEKVAELKRNGAVGYAAVPWEAICFRRGTIEFWYRDYARALEDMMRVVESPGEVDLNTGVMAWMRLGQVYDLTNRRPAAVEAYRRAIAYAPQADAAREARRYLSVPYRRDRM